MNRIIEVTDRLVAEVLPDGSIRWWEKTPVPDDGKWRGKKGVGKGRPFDFDKHTRVGPPNPDAHDWQEDDPGFENVIRAIEEG